MDYRYILHSVCCFIWIYSVRGIQEICLGDTFTAQCPENQVMVMTQALYGRMKQGKCVKYNLETGCSMDIIRITDRLCSGRKSCEFNFYTTDVEYVEHLEPCGTKELASYLEASYTCVPEINPKDCMVTDDGKENLGSYIQGASNECSKRNIPLRIKSSPGLNIKLTLYDFTYVNSDSLSSSCVPLGYVTEGVMRSNKTICSTDTHRIQEIYTSVSSDISVYFTPETVRHKDGSFLIKYEFQGCPDPSLSDNTWYRRDGNKVEVGCKDNDITRTLKCVDNKWIGDVENCTQNIEALSPEVTNKEEAGGFSTLPENTTIVIIISISVLISAVVLVLGAVYALRKRQFKNHNVDTGTLPLTKDAIYSHNKKYAPGFTDTTHTPVYNGSTYRPVQHAATCKRSKPAQFEYGNMLIKSTQEASLGSDAASFQYQQPSNRLLHQGDVEPIEDYESPYETRAPESHAYSPLGTHSKPPSANDI